MNFSSLFAMEMMQQHQKDESVPEDSIIIFDMSCVQLSVLRV